MSSQVLHIEGPEGALTYLHQSLAPEKKRHDQKRRGDAVTVVDSSETLSRCRLALSGHLLLAFDCEGPNLGRRAGFWRIKFATREECFIIDVHGTVHTPVQARAWEPFPSTWTADVVAVVKPVLEDKEVCKIIHDCKAHSEALFYRLGIKLHNVHDTQVTLFPRMSECLR